MKVILLIMILLLPTTALAGGYHSRGYGSAHSFSHGYRSYHDSYYPRYYTGYRSYSPYNYRPHRYYRHHYRGPAFTGPAFDYSAYPTGIYYRPDPPDFQYQSITPSATPEGVHTWTDSAGTVHFTDDAGKVPTRNK